MACESRKILTRRGFACFLFITSTKRVIKTQSAEGDQIKNIPLDMGGPTFKAGGVIAPAGIENFHWPFVKGPNPSL